MTAVSTSIAVLLYGMVAPSIPASAAPPAAPVVKAAKAPPVTERPDTVSAVMTARAQGSRVEILDERTESTTTWANPDGTFTTESSSGPIRVRRGDSWAPIDTTLADTGVAVTPKAALVPVELSDGGAEPFARVRQGARSFGLSWSGGLPTPTLKDDTATYHGVIPGADLEVQALPTGFSERVVVRERPDGPLTIRMPFGLSGMKLSQATNGRLTLTDSKGKAVAQAPAPHMWDSSVNPASGLPARDARVASSVENTAGGPVLVLRPDPAFLAGDVTYPVIVDPTTTLAVSTDTWLETPNYPASQIGSDELRVGTYDGGTHRARAYMKFNVAGFVGKHITDTNLRLYSYWSSTCSTAGSGVRVRRVTTAWESATIAWDNVPEVTGTGEVINTSANGNSDSCPAAYNNWDIDAIVQAWAAGSANHGIQLRAVDETDSLTWRRYRSANYVDGAAAVEPRLTVTYNSYPATATGLAVTPSKVHPYNGRRYVASLRPTLAAKLTDADAAASLKAQFEVTPDPTFADTTYTYTGTSAAVSSGGTAKLTIPAANVLPAGAHLRVRARGYDGTDYSKSWTAYLPFVLNTARPAAPTVTCPSYSEDEWTAKASAAVTCTIDTTSTDGQGYQWSLDDPNPTKYVEDTVDGNGGDPLTVSIKPADGWHTLYARGVDTGGNVSATVTAYDFGVGVGEIVSVSDGDRTQAAVALTGRAPAAKNQVSYVYHVGADPTAGWLAVPPADVTVAGTTTSVSAWPQTRSDTAQDFGGLVWDVAKTLTAAGQGDGPVQVKACFTASGATSECSAPASFTLERSGFGSSYATEPIGPGVVSLLTGDFSVTEEDATLAGLGISRTHTSLVPPAAAADSTGVFGPGWIASLPSAGMSDFSFSDHSADGFVLLVGTDGEVLTYTVGADKVTYTGVSDAEDGSVITRDSATQYTLTDTDGTKTVYVKAGGVWNVVRVDGNAEEDTTTYTIDSVGRVSRILSPVSGGISCTSALVAGCQAVDVGYATATTASSSALGDFAGRVSKITYTGYDPVTAAMKSVVVAQYQYDATGRLRATWDPRIPSPLKTTYTYDAAGRLATLAPPGQAAWTMAYDTAGRLAHVARTDPANGAAIQAVAYGVPIAGTGAPVDLSVTSTSAWGQSVDLPRVGAAVFPPSRVPARGSTGAYAPAAADYPYAGLTYLDVNGRAVNSASYGAGAWQVTTTRYDARGRLLWDLSAANRAQALAPTDATDPYVAGQADTAVRAGLLATVKTYSDDADLLSTTGPAHPVELASGTVVSARLVTSNTYDEGKPNTEARRLVTTVVDAPLVLDGGAAATAADTRTTKYDYAALVSGDTDGWTLGSPTGQTTVVGSTGLTSRTRYDNAGRVIESRLPGSTGTDAATTVTTYYTAAANSAYPVCGGKPQWAGQTCRIGPAAQPAGQSLPVTVITYNIWGQATVVTETSGSTVRTTTTAYDDAGRVSRSAVAVTPASAGGAAVPDTVTGYDAATGLETTSTAGTATVTTRYDTLGREIAHTDADGNNATVSYDVEGRVKSRSDGKGTYTYTYGGTDAAGKVERRSLPTRVDSGAGVFTGAYDADGQLEVQTYPNGLVASRGYDNDGQDASLTYAKDGTTWLGFDRTTDVHGQTVAASSPASSQAYTYDSAGRLTKAEDAYGETCTTRVYALSATSNRTALATYPGTEPSTDADPVCTTTTTATTETHTYDAASRITDSGYAYDTLGRTTTVPAAGVTGGAALTVGYQATDMVASLTQGGVTKTFTLDPTGRLRTSAVTGAPVNGTVINHYADGSDSPAWITEANGSWTRNVQDLAGNLAAVQTNAGVVTLQLPNLHGDIVATVDAATTATAISGYVEQTEFGGAREDGAAARYGWLGAKQRSSDAVAGLVLMGARLYNPTTGRFLSVDPIPGGNHNAYEYCGADPVGCTDLDGMKKYKRYKKFQCGGFFASICRAARKIDVKALGYTIKKTAQAGGATCRKKYGMTACWKAPSWMYERGGTTIGTTYVTSSKRYVTKARMRHEKEHRNQWYIFGLDFSWIYFLEPRNPCKNYFEKMAGLKDGGYHC